MADTTPQLGGTAIKPVGWDRSIIFLNIIFLYNPRSMLDLLFFLISRLNNTWSPLVIDFQIY